MTTVLQRCDVTPRRGWAGGALLVVLVAFGLPTPALLTSCHAARLLPGIHDGSSQNHTGGRLPVFSWMRPRGP